MLSLFGLTATSFALSNDKLHAGSEAGNWFGKWQYGVAEPNKVAPEGQTAEKPESKGVSCPMLTC